MLVSRACARERERIAPHFRYVIILTATAAPVNASFASHVVSCQPRQRYECQKNPISPHYMAYTGTRPAHGQRQKSAFREHRTAFSSYTVVEDPGPNRSLGVERTYNRSIISSPCVTA